jgi:hypothetical protein
MTAHQLRDLRAKIDRARRAQILAENRRRNRGTNGFASLAFDAARGDGWEALAAAIAVRRIINEAMQ